MHAWHVAASASHCRPCKMCCSRPEPDQDLPPVPTPTCLQVLPHNMSLKTWLTQCGRGRCGQGCGFGGAPACHPLLLPLCLMHSSRVVLGDRRCNNSSQPFLAAFPNGNSRWHFPFTLRAAAACKSPKAALSPCQPAPAACASCCNRCCSGQGQRLGRAAGACNQGRASGGSSGSGSGGRGSRRQRRLCAPGHRCPACILACLATPAGHRVGSAAGAAGAAGAVAVCGGGGGGRARERSRLDAWGGG